MKNYFLELFEYNRWANDLVYDSLKPLARVPEKVSVWFSHIVAAELEWYSRFVPGTKKFPLWEVKDLEELRKWQYNADSLWLKLIRKYEGSWEAALSYKNTSGEQCITPVYQILAHLANHGTHHRGMIVAKLREEGYEPPKVDLIFYTRK